MPESVKELVHGGLTHVEAPNDTRVLNQLLSGPFVGKLETLAQAKAE